MQYEVHIEKIVESRPLAVVKRRARLEDLPRVVPELCGLVWKILKAAGVKGAGRHVAVYLDEEMNIEVGVEMDGPFSGAGEVAASVLPAGLVARTVHLGPYQKLGEAHWAVREWCARNGHALAGPNWDIYGHWVDEWNRDPSKIRTDVFYLLKI